MGATKNGKAVANGNGAAHTNGHAACSHTRTRSKWSLWAVIIAVVWGLYKVADSFNVSGEASYYACARPS